MNANQLTHVIGENNNGEEVVITLRKPLYPESFVRQQQAEIEDLKNANRFIQNFAEEQHQRAVALESELDRAVELYTDKAIENEALKEKVKQNADLEEKVDLCKEKLKPIVWMSEVEGGTMYTNYEYPESIPLYTHPVKEDEGKVCARCGAIAYDPVITQTVKEQLTDEEIIQINKEEGTCWDVPDRFAIQLARAILRKAQEK